MYGRKSSVCCQARKRSNWRNPSCLRRRRIGEDLQPRRRGAYGLMEAYTPPNSGPPLHLHQREDEWWFILDGNFLFEIDGNSVHAGPGDTVFAPRGGRHTFQNIGSVTGRALVTVVPGGLDAFFQEVSAAVPRGTGARFCRSPAYLSQMWIGDPWPATEQAITCAVETSSSDGRSCKTLADLCPPGTSPTLTS